MHDDRYLYLVKKLISKTEKFGDCLIWSGALMNGYGSFPYNGRNIRVHRLAAYLFRSIPLHSDICVLHKSECLNKACWNPEHTYEGNQKDNVRDSIQAKTHVPWGWQRR
jgi:hypothetical protein